MGALCYTHLVPDDLAEAVDVCTQEGQCSSQLLVRLGGWRAVHCGRQQLVQAEVCVETLSTAACGNKKCLH